MNRELINWLLEGPSWLKYATQLQLLDLKPDPYMALQNQQLVKIVCRLKDDKVGIPALKTGNVLYTKAGNAYWDMFFLADIGLKISNLELDDVIEEIFSLQTPEGTFVSQDNIKPSYFCIPTILLSSMIKMGYKEDDRLNKYFKIILDSQRLDGGWHCAKSRAVGKKLQDTVSCPMDNLNILMLFGQYEEYRCDNRFNGAIDLLLSHWEKKEEKWRPYGFGIGEQFMKLKYPAIKYGILRVLDVLSLFPYAMESKIFKDMLDSVQQKSHSEKYYAESIVKAYWEFDFGQKKEPSRWITFLIKRIEKRFYEYKQ